MKDGLEQVEGRGIDVVYRCGTMEEEAIRMWETKFLMTEERRNEYLHLDGNGMRRGKEAFNAGLIQ